MQKKIFMVSLLAACFITSLITWWIIAVKKPAHLPIKDYSDIVIAPLPEYADATVFNLKCAHHDGAAVLSHYPFLLSKLSYNSTKESIQGINREDLPYLYSLLQDPCFANYKDKILIAGCCFDEPDVIIPIVLDQVRIPISYNTLYKHKPCFPDARSAMRDTGYALNSLNYIRSLCFLPPEAVKENLHYLYQHGNAQSFLVDWMNHGLAEDIGFDGVVYRFRGCVASTLATYQDNQMFKPVRDEFWNYVHKESKPKFRDEALWILELADTIAWRDIRKQHWQDGGVGFPELTRELELKQSRISLKYIQKLNNKYD